MVEKMSVGRSFYRRPMYSRVTESEMS